MRRKGKAESQEHVLPQCIGGRLKSNLLCRTCNNEAGSNLVAKLKKDPGVIFAVEALRNTVPELSAAFLEGRAYRARAGDGTVLNAVYGKGRLRLLAGPGANGSLIQGTTETRKSIGKHLQKLGYLPGEVDSFLQRFDSLAEDSPLPLCQYP